MRWLCGRFAFEFGAAKKTPVMGIVNVTPDSFSDGGRFLAADAAIQQGLDLAAAGADIIDVGGESTRPGAAAVSEAEEKRRVLPVIKHLADAGLPVSADTTKPGVMRAALAAGAAIINDVGGFCDAAAMDIAAASDCGVVIMHMRGSPPDMQRNPAYDDVVGEVGGFLRRQMARLIDAGADEERICLDPGIGFGKTEAHNIALLQNLPQLSAGRPLLLGISRKSLFKRISGDGAADERDAVSAAAAAMLARRGADIVRAHNVKMTRQALAAADMLAQPAHG